MDEYGDHAFVCRGDLASAGFQLRHRVVQQSFSIIFCEARISRVVELTHLRFQRDVSLESGRGSGLTRLADILLYSLRSDSHC